MNSAEELVEQVVHITRGDSRDHRPDLNQLRLELIIEHQTGMLS
jgi:transposase